MGLFKLALIGGAAYYAGKKFNENNHSNGNGQPGQNPNETGNQTWGWGNRHGHCGRGNKNNTTNGNNDNMTQYPNEKQQYQYQYSQAPNGMTTGTRNIDHVDSHNYQYPAHTNDNNNNNNTTVYPSEKNMATTTTNERPLSPPQNQPTPLPAITAPWGYGHDYTQSHPTNHPRNIHTEPKMAMQTRDVEVGNHIVSIPVVGDSGRASPNGREMGEREIVVPPAYATGGTGVRREGPLSPGQRMFPGEWRD